MSTKKAIDRRLPPWRQRGAVLLWVSWGLILGGVVVAGGPLVWQEYTNAIVNSTAEDALATWDVSAAVDPQRGNWLGSRRGTGQRVVPTSGRFLLEIPALGVRRVFPDRADPETLRAFGLGHISWSAWPEEEGTVAIAGHRTTYGAPFRALDRLRTGDVIHLAMPNRTYTYAVTERVRVSPQQVAVLQNPTGHRLALVTCDPPYSAQYRLVIFAEMVAD